MRGEAPPLLNGLWGGAPALNEERPSYNGPETTEPAATVCAQSVTCCPR